MTTPQAHEVNAVIGPGGSIAIVGLPFRTGETVTVRVVPSAPRHSPKEIERSAEIRHGYRCTVLRYDDPFEPAVPLEDWNVFRDDQQGL